MFIHIQFSDDSLHKHVTGPPPLSSVSSRKELLRPQGDSPYSHKGTPLQPQGDPLPPTATRRPPYSHKGTPLPPTATRGPPLQPQWDPLPTATRGPPHSYSHKGTPLQPQGDPPTATRGPPLQPQGDPPLKATITSMMRFTPNDFLGCERKITDRYKERRNHTSDKMAGSPIFQKRTQNRFRGFFTTSRTAI